jgi:hypothetical protein
MALHATTNLKSTMAARKHFLELYLLARVLVMCHVAQVNEAVRACVRMVLLGRSGGARLGEHWGSFPVSGSGVFRKKCFF